MKKSIFIFILCFTITTLYSQKPGLSKNITLRGIVQDKVESVPLEYATITLTNVASPNEITGGITNLNGQFSFLITAGVYDLSLIHI